MTPFPQITRRAWLVIAATSILLVPLALWFRNTEPKHQGKTLSEWFQEFCAASQKPGIVVLTRVPEGRRLLQLSSPFASTGTQIVDPSGDAIRAIGSNAVPFLIKRLRTVEDPAHRAYRKAYDALPGSIARLIPKPKDYDSIRVHATTAMACIGDSSGAEAVDSLLQTLKEPNLPVILRVHVEQALAMLLMDSRKLRATILEISNQEFAIQLIDQYYLRGTDMALVLARATASTNESVRARAFRNLKRLGQDAGPAVEILVKNLSQTDREIRYQSASTLAAIGTAARSAIPALSKAANDSDELVRNAAIRALTSVAPEGGAP